MEQFLEIASFEAFPADDWAFRIFNLPSKGAMSDNLQNIGYESTFAIENTGSVYVILNLCFVFLGVLFFLQKYHCRSDKVRQISIYLKNKLCWNGLLTVLSEVYLECCVAALINIKEMQWEKDIAIYHSNIWAVGAIIVLTIAPICYLGYAYKNRDLWKSEEWQNKFGALFQEMYLSESNSDYLKLQRTTQVIFVPALFFMRRFLFALVLVRLPHFRVLHLLIFCLSCIGVIICLFYVWPYSSSRTMLEIFNELLILITFYHLLGYTDLMPIPNVRYAIGFSQLIFFGIFLLVHIAITLRNLLSNLKYLYKLLSDKWRKKQKKFPES